MCLACVQFVFGPSPDSACSLFVAVTNFKVSLIPSFFFFFFFFLF